MKETELLNTVSMKSLCYVLVSEAGQCRHVRLFSLYLVKVLQQSCETTADPACSSERPIEKDYMPSLSFKVQVRHLPATGKTLTCSILGLPLSLGKRLIASLSFLAHPITFFFFLHAVQLTFQVFLGIVGWLKQIQGERTLFKSMGIVQQ